MNYSTRLASDQFRSGVCLIGEGKEEAFTEGAPFRDNISVIESIFCQHWSLTVCCTAGLFILSSCFALCFLKTHKKMPVLSPHGHEELLCSLQTLHRADLWVWMCVSAFRVHDEFMCVHGSCRKMSWFHRYLSSRLLTSTRINEGKRHHQPQCLFIQPGPICWWWVANLAILIVSYRWLPLIFLF